jgi:ABC-type antimicrobial peptide transport system ATPase subunit
MWLIIENTTTIEVALDSLSRIIVIIDITATHITVTIDRFRLQTIEILTYTSEKFIKIIDDLINTKLASTILLTASK